MSKIPRQGIPGYPKISYDNAKCAYPKKNDDSTGQTQKKAIPVTIKQGRMGTNH